MEGRMQLVGLIIVGREVLLPLKSCTVNAEVHGYVVGLNSTLKYVNDGDTPVEVLFRFPVDESFAVVGMEAVIEGRKIKAEIKKKEEAKQDYKKAIASGHTAALAEEMSGDIFSISLGNLPVRAKAELHLKLVGELPIDAEGGVRFTLPAVLKPRYTPAGSADPLAPAGGATQMEAPAVHDFTMAVKSEGVADVTSPTHMISVNKDGDVVNVSLSGEDAQPLKKDLVVLIHQTEPHTPKVVYELGDPSKSQRSYMGAPAVMLSFFPEFEVKRAACEFVFLVDRSGSMRGSYIRSASETLILFLKSIPPGCSFNIIGFGSSHTSLFRESVSYDQENLEYAIRHAKSLQADLGGTELLSPLKHIFSQRLLPGLPRQIFVLTDGSVSNTYLCIDEVARNSDKCRVFTFGIGSGASTALVNGLAKAGRGTAEFIKEGERMQPKVISSLKRALQPPVAEVKVKFELQPGVEVIQAPHNIFSVYKGDKVLVYGILKSTIASENPFHLRIKGTATLEGTVLGKAFTHSIPIDIPGSTMVGRKRLRSATKFELPFVHQLAAKNILKVWSNSSGSLAIKREREAESINLSIESSVISEHTAFVAIDEVKHETIEDAIAVFDVSATMTELSFPSTSYWLGGYSGSRGVRVKQTARRSTGGKAPRATLKKKCAAKKRKTSKRAHVIRGKAPKRAAAYVASRKSGSGRVHSLFQASGLSQLAVSKPNTVLQSLETLISMQHATGYWPLGAVSDKILKKSDIKKKCPPKVPQNIWATIVALVLLEERYAKQKDEWELVALKAENWLSNQTWPKGVTVGSLRTIAKTVI